MSYFLSKTFAFNQIADYLHDIREKSCCQAAKGASARSNRHLGSSYLSHRGYPAKRSTPSRWVVLEIETTRVSSVELPGCFNCLLGRGCFSVTFSFATREQEKRRDERRDERQEKARDAEVDWGKGLQRTSSLSAACIYSSVVFLLPLCK